ncbi:Clavaminate synthase-like protein [Punctularia strigosozonata HHB-11173 SS5]|uniref:Clavaminate synthase-like protein n=1 Tax=Punctularia strigosozonata (strain HHB-11173) TaxID=741275 RepID=UPI0004417415|nr:Clavaminate synthase-like protein [Punctularia strigosozonata HHB-11173 SS5]EIN06544.1 Clavaminate synthase-like protein [Punctularia strigosozonata HHB-11173 SS5]
MPFDVFIEAFMERERTGEDAAWTGYLAQYGLLDDVPSLNDDLKPPLIFTRSGRGDEWRTNLWIGTEGTFTPIHRDPYHNLFCQVVGIKQISVFPPSASAQLYLSPSHLQRNTSVIPCPNPDPEAYPLFYSALKDSWQVTVQPGEILFIPRGFYHSVQSLSKSISVNSWFL